MEMAPAIDRARRFGEKRRFAAGEALAAIGEVGLEASPSFSAAKLTFTATTPTADASTFIHSARARSLANWRSSLAGLRSATA